MYIPPTNLDREIHLTQKLQEICQLQGAKVKTFLYDIKDTSWYITDILNNPTVDLIRDHFKAILEKVFHSGHTHKKLQWDNFEMTRKITYTYSKHKGLQEVLVFQYDESDHILFINWTHSKD